MHYVAGLMFDGGDEDNEVLVLIKKNKPPWQTGFYNAVGGKVESGESPFDAMRREFKEETNVDSQAWRRFVTLVDEGGKVDFFYVTDNEGVSKVVTTTDEEVAIFQLGDLPGIKTIPNIPWLVRMALEARSVERNGIPSLSFTVIEHRQ